MRKYIFAILLPFALSAAAQGFISPQVKIAKKQYEQKTAKARVSWLSGCRRPKTVKRAYQKGSR